MAENDSRRRRMGAKGTTNLTRKLETIIEEKVKEPRKKGKFEVKETRSQKAARLEQLKESFQLERALRGDFSEFWVPAEESV